MLNCEELGKRYKNGSFSINKQNLDSLIGCPEHIMGEFSCHDNNLTNLIGGPQSIDGSYLCYRNSLTDLVGCASHIGGSLYFHRNPITSLVGIHKIIKSCQNISFDNTQITHGGIGLLLIANLKSITTLFSSKQFQIISNYLDTGTKGMMECSKELISKGYVNYAKL